MPAVPKIALAIVLSALVCAPAASASKASDMAAMQRAVTDFKSSLRHNDGERACSRMTLKVRKQLLAIIVAEIPGHAGAGCVRMMDLYGRDVYVEFKGPTKLRGMSAHHGNCVQWRDSDGTAHGVKQRGRWKLAGSGGC